ncbi:5'-nucleotidase protein, partial [Opisthorchis viverrini]
RGLSALLHSSCDGAIYLLEPNYCLIQANFDRRLSVDVNQRRLFSQPLDVTADKLKDKRLHVKHDQMVAKERKSRRIVLLSDMGSKDNVQLHILHFNDVYNVEGQSTEPVAGAARFHSALKAHGAEDKSIVLFSGDALSPSMISSITQGRHVPPILNDLFVRCAVLGNHDLDFGLDILCECIEESNFPWLNTNVLDRDTNSPLAGLPTYHIIEHAGLRIGLIGLLEEEWVATLSCVDAEDLEVLDICEAARSWTQKLKQPGPESCDLVIALTHMRWPNDRKLAAGVPEIDLILGGHDHDYVTEWLDEPGKPVRTRAILKSGTDYRSFSHIRLTFDKQAKIVSELTVEEVIVDSRWEINEKILCYVKTQTERLEKKMELSLGRVEVPLDARFSSIRTKETNVGNFVSDIVLTGVDAEVAIINSGTLRADRIIEAGTFRLRDLINLLPMLDPMVVLQATGKQIYEALENGVSQYPKHEGRFPIVSGVRFAFDPRKPPGSRIPLSSVTIQNKPLNLKAKHKLCVKHYMANGRDGYDMLRECPVLVDDEDGPILSTLIQNYFRTIQVLKGFEKARTRHRQSIVSIVERHHLVDELLGQTKSQGTKDVRHYWNKARHILIENHEMHSANAIAP